MRIQEQVPLKAHTTLKIGGPAQYMATAHTLEDIESVFRIARHEHLPVSVLGGGSNILVPETGVEGIVLRLALFETTFHSTKNKTVEVSVGAGVVWDDLVARTVANGLWGIENLSGIPGTVGAAPIQNIGAYGTELRDVCSWVEVFNPQTMNTTILSNEECMFSYRDSIFKQDAGNFLIVTRVGITVQQNGIPNLSYKDLAEHFAYQPTSHGGVVRDAVLSIRARKFPNMSLVGTAGSFFKNPIISQEHFEMLQEEYPDIPGYKTISGQVKIPLAWILDHVCGVKGYTSGTVSLHDAQPLVLVTHKGAREQDVCAFADDIARMVKEKTNIVIEREVQTLVPKSF